MIVGWLSHIASIITGLCTNMSIEVREPKPAGRDAEEVVIRRAADLFDVPWIARQMAECDATIDDYELNPYGTLFDEAGQSVGKQFLLICNHNGRKTIQSIIAAYNSEDIQALVGLFKPRPYLVVQVK